MPDVGDELEHEGCVIQIESMGDARIQRLVIRDVETPSAPPDDDAE